MNVKTEINKVNLCCEHQKDADEQMISYEVIYEPDAKDAHGEWMSAETILRPRSLLIRQTSGIVKDLFHMIETDSFTIEDLDSGRI